MLPTMTSKATKLITEKSVESIIKTTRKESSVKLSNRDLLLFGKISFFFCFLPLITTQNLFQSIILVLFITFCLTAVKHRVIKYCDTIYERDGINRFWSIKNSTEALKKFRSKKVNRKVQEEPQAERFRASKLSTNDFSTLHIMLPHHLIKDKLTAFIEHKFIREKTLYLACNK